MSHYSGTGLREVKGLMSSCGKVLQNVTSTASYSGTVLREVKGLNLGGNPCNIAYLQTCVEAPHNKTLLSFYTGVLERA